MATTSLRFRRFPWQSAALVGGLLIWIVLCALQVTQVLERPGTLRVAICIILVAAPFLMLKIARMPVYLLSAYAAMIPFDELLSTGATGTLTKLVAMLTGASLVLSMVGMQRVIPPSRSLIAVLALMVYSGATIFWALDPAAAWTMYIIYMQYFGLFLVIALYPAQPSDLKLVIGAAIAGALLAALYGDYFFRQSIDADRLLIYAGANSIDPNEYAAALIAPFAISLMLFLRERVSIAKVLWLAALVILTSAFAISGSRGSGIAVAAILIFYLIHSPYKRQLVIFAGAILASSLASPLARRFTMGDLSTGDGRIDIWKVGFSAFQHYWLGGAGVGNFETAFTRFFLSTPHQPLPWARAAHSIFMQSAVEYGIIGFVLVMAVWYIQFRELASVRADQGVVDLCTALRAAVLGLFVAGISLDLMMYKYTWIAFSLIALTRSALVVRGIPLEDSKLR